MRFQRLFLSLVLAAAVTVSGCVAMYRPDVAQGSLVTQEAVESVRLDMTKRQVRFLLGSPSIVDPFHPDRWDYVYRLKKANGDYEQRSITLMFENDKLVRMAAKGFALAPDVGIATAQKR